MKAVKNATEIAGTHAAQVRDGAAVANFLAWFDREAPKRQAHRDRRRRGAGNIPPRHRPAQGAVVPDHLRRRAERRDRALPRDARDQPHHRAGRTVPGRLRRAISRTAPPTSPAPSRSARRRRRCASASPACSRATSRSRARCFRTARPARSSTRSRASISGPPASTSTTAPATASAAISRCTRARRAFPSSAPRALKRGMILSNEPGYYKTGAYGIRIENLVLVTEAQIAGAEKADERVRDAHASRRSIAG